MHERCKGHARASSYSVRVAGAAPNSSHKPLSLASAVIAGCHKHPVWRQEPEQHPASRAVDAGADVDSIESAPQLRIRFMQRRYLCGNRNFTARSPLDRARTAASSPRNDLVKNCRVHPTHC